METSGMNTKELCESIINSLVNEFHLSSYEAGVLLAIVQARDFSLPKEIKKWERCVQRGREEIKNAYRELASRVPKLFQK